jgi:deoxyribodipyrimidine photo-lyase
MRTLLLFGNDLRIHDNPALSEAALASKLHCLFVVDPTLFKPGRYQQPALSPKRWCFLQEALIQLDQSLITLGQWLDVQQGNWVEVVSHTIESLEIEKVVLSHPVGLDELKALDHLKKHCPATRFSVIDTFTLFEQGQSDLLDTKLPKHFTPFRHRANSLTVTQPCSAVRALPSPLQPPSKSSLLTADTSQEHALAAHGGEGAALSHLEAYFNSQAPIHYKATRNALSDWEASSKCSFWLSQGALSCRTLWKATLDYEQQHGENEGTDWLRFELLWREYFQWLAKQQGYRLFAFKGVAKHPPLTSFYPQRFRAWCEGETPYPLVNAIMRELSETGYISNRARQIAASALVNELQVDWRYGAAWFEQHLLDYDVASNWGNWQYIAGVGADPRGGRHFNLEKQRQQFDPEGHYQTRWLGPQAHKTAPLDSMDAADWPIIP